MSKFKRKGKLKADAILSADLHIRPDVPICRTDDFFAAQEKKLEFILDLSRKNNGCPILVAGDLGRRPLNTGWPTWLLRWTIEKLRGSLTIAIFGQHDLPNHRLDLWEESGVGVLEAAGVVRIVGAMVDGNKILPCHLPVNVLDKFTIIPFPYGSEIFDVDFENKYEKTDKPIIAMAHQMVIEDKPLWPGQKAPKGHQLLKKFPDYDLILTGDNHNPFVAEYQERKLVNPGSMMRTTAEQENHKPRVYLWWAKTNEIKAVYLPIEKGVISREHIKNIKERDVRNTAFIARVNEDVEIQLSYENNIENYFNKYRTAKPIKNKVWEAVQ